VIREVVKHADFPSDILIDYYYDINGRLAHITEEARTRSLRWDEQGRWLSSMLQGQTASNTMRFEN
jgi:YD repeat-containing protein